MNTARVPFHRRKSRKRKKEPTVMRGGSRQDILWPRITERNTDLILERHIDPARRVKECGSAAAGYVSTIRADHPARSRQSPDRQLREHRKDLARQRAAFHRTCWRSSLVAAPKQQNLGRTRGGTPSRTSSSTCRGQVRSGNNPHHRDIYVVWLGRSLTCRLGVGVGWQQARS